MRNQYNLDNNKEEVKRLLTETDLNRAEIGRRYGVTSAAVSAFVLRHGLEVTYTRVCEAPDCGRSFTSSKAAQRFCTRKCVKRRCEQRRRGAEILTKVCGLSEFNECAVTFTTASTRKVFCTNRCSDRYAYLVYQKRINEAGYACEVCGEDMIWDFHHIKERNEGGTDEPSNLTVLCPNHHHALHRGLATLDGSLTYRCKGIVREIRTLEVIGVPDWIGKYLERNAPRHIKHIIRDAGYGAEA